MDEPVRPAVRHDVVRDRCPAGPRTRPGHDSRLRRHGHGRRSDGRVGLDRRPPKPSRQARRVGADGGHRGDHARSCCKHTLATECSTTRRRDRPCPPSWQVVRTGTPRGCPGPMALAVILLGCLWAGPRICAWALRRPGDRTRFRESRVERRRPMPPSPLATLVRVDRANVWRARTAAPRPARACGPARRGRGERGVALGLTRAAARARRRRRRTPVRRQHVLPRRRGRHLAGDSPEPAAACGDRQDDRPRGDHRWQLPRRGDRRQCARRWTDHGADVVAMACCLVSCTAVVLATCLRLSIRTPHRADLRGHRDTPAPPAAMAVYSVRLATVTTLIGLLFALAAHEQSFVRLRRARIGFGLTERPVHRPKLPSLGRPIGAFKSRRRGVERLNRASRKMTEVPPPP